MLDNLFQSLYPMFCTAVHPSLFPPNQINLYHIIYNNYCGHEKLCLVNLELCCIHDTISIIASSIRTFKEKSK